MCLRASSTPWRIKVSHWNAWRKWMVSFLSNIGSPVSWSSISQSCNTRTLGQTNWKLRFWTVKCVNLQFLHVLVNSNVMINDGKYICICITSINIGELKLPVSWTILVAWDPESSQVLPAHLQWNACNSQQFYYNSWRIVALVQLCLDEQAQGGRPHATNEYLLF